MTKLIILLTIYTINLSASETIIIPSFFQEQRTFVLEGQKVYSVAIASNGNIFAGTDSGLFFKPNDSQEWKQIPGIDSPTYFVSTFVNKVVAISGRLSKNILVNGKTNFIVDNKVIQTVKIPNNLKIDVSQCDFIVTRFQGIIGNSDDLFKFHIGTNHHYFQ